MIHLPETFVPSCGLYYQPLWQRAWVWMVLVGLIVAGVLFVIGYIFYQRYWKKKVKPPQIVAFEGLEVIKPHEGVLVDARCFYQQLTMLLKRYLQDRCHLPAVGCTDVELAALLAHAVGDDHERNAFADLLARSQAAKFSPQTNMVNIKDDWLLVHEFIRSKELALQQR